MVRLLGHIAPSMLLATISYAAVWDPPGNGTVVEIGVYVDDFLGMTNVQMQEFRLDLWLMTRWRDARVPKPSNGRREIYLDPADDGAAPIWVPKLTFTNQRSMLALGDHLFANVDGTIHRYQRFLVDFEANMDFLNFPFDHHVWKVKIEMLDAFIEAVELSPWIGPFGNKSHAPPSGMKAEAKSIGIFSWQLQRHGQECMKEAAEGGICDPSGFILLAKKTKPPFSGAKFQGWEDGACLSESGSASLTDTSFCDAQLPRKFNERNLQCMCELPKKSRIEVQLAVKRKTERLRWNYFVPCYVCWFIGYVSHWANPSDYGTRISTTVLSLLTFEFLSERAKDYYPQTEQLMWINAFHNLNLFFLVALVANNVQIAWAARRCSFRVSVRMNAYSRIIVLAALSIASIALFTIELEDAQEMQVLNEVYIALPLTTSLIIAVRFFYGMWTLDRGTIETAFASLTDQSTASVHAERMSFPAYVAWFGMMIVYRLRLMPIRYTEIDDNELLHLWEAICIKGIGYGKLALYVDSTTAALTAQQFCQGVQSMCNVEMFERMVTLTDIESEGADGDPAERGSELEEDDTTRRPSIGPYSRSKVLKNAGFLAFMARIEKRGISHVNFDYFKTHYKFLLFGAREVLPDHSNDPPPEPPDVSGVRL